MHTANEIDAKTSPRTGINVNSGRNVAAIVEI